MSGIGGIWRLDGAQVEPESIERILRAQAHRGPDGADAWSGGAVAVAHAALHATRESQHEHLPLISGDGSLVLSADARIDNRAELISVLRLGPAGTRVIGDAELILASYQKWGEDCPRHLLGDFAFVVWDARERRMFCARDVFGVRPLHYHIRPDRLFVVASELKAVAALAEVPRELDDDWVAQYLMLSYDDEAATVYQAVRRLPPAHSMTVTTKGADVRRYWALDPGLEVRRRSSAEYEEEFRAIFFDAVGCRLRSPTATGSTLSGGLDSSSIACVARDILTRQRHDPLRTFSLVFDETPESDERRYIRTVLRKGGVVPRFIRLDEMSPVDAAIRFAPYSDGPVFTPNIAMSLAVASAARESGTRVVLSGYFGDDAISHGLENFGEMVRQGQVLKAVVAGYQYARNFGVPPGRVYKRLMLAPVAPAALLNLRKRARPQSVRDERPSISALYESMVGNRIRPRIAERARIADEAARSSKPIRREHYLSVVWPYHARVIETEDLVAAAYGIEIRLPFLDRRVVEYAYGLPASQKIHGGWTRSILRRSLVSVLPPEICWRTDKGDLSHWFRHAMADLDRERLVALAMGVEGLEDYVDARAVRGVLDEAILNRCPVRLTALWYPIALALWLRDSATFARGAIAVRRSTLPNAVVDVPSVGNKVGARCSASSQSYAEK